MCPTTFLALIWDVFYFTWEILIIQKELWLLANILPLQDRMNIFFTVHSWRPFKFTLQRFIAFRCPCSSQCSQPTCSFFAVPSCSLPVPWLVWASLPRLWNVLKRRSKSASAGLSSQMHWRLSHIQKWLHLLFNLHNIAFVDIACGVPLRDFYHVCNVFKFSLWCVSPWGAIAYWRCISCMASPLLPASWAARRLGMKQTIARIMH